MVSIDDLRAVHHPTRRRILDLLAAEGPSQVGTLARRLTQQVGSISHHLRMLERSGAVERAPELATDGRTSWWRTVPASFTWSADDYAASPAEHVVALAAERLNIEHQLGRLAGWRRAAATFSESWRRAAFATDVAASATPEELADLGRRLGAVVVQWRAEIDLDDGRQRHAVYWFAHGFPMQP